MSARIVGDIISCPWLFFAVFVCLPWRGVFEEHRGIKSIGLGISPDQLMGFPRVCGMWLHSFLLFQPNPGCNNTFENIYIVISGSVSSDNYYMSSGKL